MMYKQPAPFSHRRLPFNNLFQKFGHYLACTILFIKVGMDGKCPFIHLLNENGNHLFKPTDPREAATNY